MSITKRILSILCCITLVSCADVPWGEGEAEYPASSKTVLQQLQEGQDAVLLSSSSQITVDLAWGLGQRQEEHSVELVLEYGEVSLFADAENNIEILDLTLQIADIQIRDRSPALSISDIELSLAEPVLSAQSEWNQDSQMAIAWATLPLSLQWAVETPDGSKLPLGAQIVDLPLFLALEQSEDGVSVQLFIEQKDTVWKWASIVELRNLSSTLGSTP